MGLSIGMGRGRGGETEGERSLSLLFFFFNLFIFFFGCTQAFSSCSQQGILFVAVRGLLIAVASLVAEHRI